MSYIIRVRPDAERDTERIYLWYEEQSSGLGAECVAELDAVYDRLAETLGSMQISSMACDAGFFADFQLVSST